jgi:3-hydroxyisobutyrate dehydrogenase
MRVAVVGTGIMGAGIARSLRRAGHDVVAWNRTRSRAEPLLEDGIAIADTVSQAVADADAVITILFDTDATLGVCRQIADALRSDAVWIQSATLGPDGVRRVAECAGREVVDAPVLGTKKPAEEGKLVVLASGDPNNLHRCRPVFETIGARTVVVSDRVGDASALKLVCNAWIALITAGTAQSVAFAERLGVDPRLFLGTIAGTPTDSAYAQLKGNAVLSGDYTTSFAVDGVVKDVGLMIEAAESAHFPTDLLDTVRTMFARASAAGHGASDMAAVRFAFPA